MSKFHYLTNSREVTIQATSREEADKKFQEMFGTHSERDHVLCGRCGNELDQTDFDALANHNATCELVTE